MVKCYVLRNTGQTWNKKSPKHPPLLKGIQLTLNGFPWRLIIAFLLSLDYTKPCQRTVFMNVDTAQARRNANPLHLAMQVAFFPPFAVSRRLQNGAG